MKVHRFLLLMAIALVLLVSGCGGGGPSLTAGGGSGGGTGGGSGGGTGGSGGGSTNNVAPLVVDSGPSSLILTGQADQDLAFTTITICVPGSTTSCQTIDHVQVDTGSVGLRIPAQVLTLTLPQQTSGANTIFDCVQFVDATFIWGPVASADIQIAGEAAKSVPVQIANNSTPPASCGTTGQIATVADLGANAILGVGPFLQDATAYFSCSGSACIGFTQPAASQLQNPVAMFATDNNGVILQLPAVSDTGQATDTGNLIFGIGTQSNNGLGSAVVLPINPNTGLFAANFNGVLYNDATGHGSGGSGGSSVIDSGSNGFFFLDSATLTNQFLINMPDCPSNGNAKGFYCPASVTPISVNVIGEGSSGTPSGSARTITFNVANASTLFQTSGVFVFNDVGGPNSNSFDFGLPFFLGKTVFTAFAGRSTPSGTGPYFAF